MNITLSLRGNTQLIGLFDLVSEEFHPELSRSEIINEAVNYVLSTKNIIWPEIVELKNTIDFSGNRSSNEVPTFLQLRVNEEKWANVSTYVAKGFIPPLKKMQTPFLVKVVMIAYLENLKSLKNESKNESIISINSVFEVSDIIKDFIDIALCDSNSKEFLEIRNLINKYKKRK